MMYSFRRYVRDTDGSGNWKMALMTQDVHVAREFWDMQCVQPDVQIEFNIDGRPACPMRIERWCKDCRKALPPAKDGRDCPSHLKLSEPNAWTHNSPNLSIDSTLFD